jgi:type VI secretion system secreted protein Hcp
MPFNGYLTIAGQKQGAMNGTVTEKGKENSILIHAFSCEVISPRDPATGQATGKAQHEPVTILKDVDKTSPLLWTALVNNETLTTWILRFFSTDATGLATQVYTVTLTNASIGSITQSMLDNEDAANTTLPLQEELTFSYQKIQWTWTDGGVTAQDDWLATTV